MVLPVLEVFPDLLKPQWLAVLLISVCAVTVGRVFYLRFLSPLACVPGPFWSSISRWGLVYDAIHQQNWIDDDYHRKYGPLVRTGPDQVSCTDWAVVRKVMAAGSGFTKSYMTEALQGRSTFDIALERDEKIHGPQRRLISNAYTMSTMKELEEAFQSALSVLLANIDAAKGRPIDFSKWSQMFAFDAIGEITFSEPFGFMVEGDDRGFFLRLRNIFDSMSWLAHVPWLYWFGDCCPLLGQFWAIFERHTRIRDFAVARIQERNARGSDRRDLLGRFFDVHQRKPAEFDINSLTSIVRTNILAGSDTTSITIRAVLYFVAKSPSWKAKLQDELDQRYKIGALGLPAKFSEALDLPVFQACLAESMRLHPILTAPFVRCVPEPGVDACGTYLPPGTLIALPQWTLHRDKEVFGPDANEFNPGRWLVDKGKRAVMERSMLQWGIGSRTCLGKNVAIMELSKTIPSLFLQYDIQLEEQEWTVHYGFMATPINLQVRFLPRLGSAFESRA